jgi:chromosome segregation ATPase
LAEAIKNNKGIQSLDLSNNNIGDEGASAFGLTIKWNKTLTSLDLSSNKIGNMGGTDFALNLQTNQVLQHVNLRNNSMQEKTGELMANYLKSNCTLLSLDITFNDFNYKHLTILEKKIKENQKDYKAAAVDRYKKEIGIWRANQVKLEETERRLLIAREELQEKENIVSIKMKTLEIAELEERERLKELKENIAEHTTQISKTEAKHISITHEASKIRADKEARYWSFVQKLHKEKDSNNRMEKRIKSKKQQIDEMKTKFDKEITSREEQLRIIMFDRNAAEMDYNSVQQQVERVKAFLAESMVELTPVDAPKKRSLYQAKQSTRFPNINKSR